MTDEPTFVLVHGGLHGAWCWERLVPLLPGPALAVDLPGRPGNPGHKRLCDLLIADSVHSIVAKVHRADPGPVVLVGHSMAGLSVPSAAAALGDQVEAMILVAAIVPPDGKSMVDDSASVLRPLLRRRFARQVARHDGTMTLPRWMAKSMFCNDMGPADARWVLDQLVPDAPAVGLEAVSAIHLSPSVGIGYVKMLNDKAVRPAQADRCISRLDHPVVLEIDAGHNVMISDPAALAQALVAILDAVRC